MHVSQAADKLECSTGVPMKTLALSCVLLVAAGTLSLARAADAPAGKQQFTTSFVVTATKDGKRTTLAEPAITTNDGEEGTFLAGGEVPIDPDGKELLPFGVT